MRVARAFPMPGTEESNSTTFILWIDSRGSLIASNIEISPREIDNFIEDLSWRDIFAFSNAASRCSIDNLGGSDGFNGVNLQSLGLDLSLLALTWKSNWLLGDQ